MKYVLVAAIIAALFAIQSAHAAESAFDIAAELIDASELPKDLPQATKKAPKVEVIADDEVEVASKTDDAVVAEVMETELPESIEVSKTAPKEENSAELPAAEQDERQPAAAEETMVAETPGTLDFDMSTIDMLGDALPEPKESFSEIAKSK